MRKLRVLWFFVFTILLGCALLFWMRNYPNPDDPKNLQYVLWKSGLNPSMNLDTALLAMTHDRWPVRRVAGLSKEQLQAHFGYIRSGNEATPCGKPKDRDPKSLAGELGIHPGADEVVTLRASNWMVILEHGVAVDVVVCKG